VKTLGELQSECAELGIPVARGRRPSREDYISALREYLWRREHPGEPLPPQIHPMLLGKWADLDPAAAAEIEQEGSGWLVQPKLDGVRALLHVGADRVRITSRHISVVTYRLAELQENLPHLTEGMGRLPGTILDGELVCPRSAINTGDTLTAHPLQATTAVLATRPSAARDIQERQGAWLRFHAFDVLRFRDRDVTPLPLLDRLDVLAGALAATSNPYVEPVPGHVVGKAEIHHRVVDAGAEGTVWKQLRGAYEAGRRVRHWLKRKAEVRLDAFVSGFKPGDPGNGHAHLVGAVAFSRRQPGGEENVVAWVSSWSDAERQAMTLLAPDGTVRLNPVYLGRRALIAGQDLAVKSGRLRHARFLSWTRC
jgi:ATP-dependent DNA ligase